MYYQTPAMRNESPDKYLPGTEVEVDGGVAVAIQKPDGKYLTVLADGSDADSDVILDQEKFIVLEHRNIVMADRMHKDPPNCWAVTILSS